MCLTTQSVCPLTSGKILESLLSISGRKVTLKYMFSLHFPHSKHLFSKSPTRYKEFLSLIYSKIHYQYLPACVLTCHESLLTSIGYKKKNHEQETRDIQCSLVLPYRMVSQPRVEILYIKD